MKKILYTVLIFTLLAGSSSCVKDLDQYPYTDTTSASVYTSVEGYESVLSGIYAIFVQRFENVDASEARRQNYIRVLIKIQDCTTDAADPIWLSGGQLRDLNGLSWTASDPWCAAMYYHIYNIVVRTNELIRNCTEEKIADFSDADKAQIRKFRDDARFIRAWTYWQALDFYYQMPFVTENDPIGSFIPTIYDRKQMFSFIESELKSLLQEGHLPETAYAHANQGAVNALLARLYLNAETYIGEKKYTECISACKEVIEDGYSLEDVYSKLFNGDNHLRAMNKNEIIFSIACDGMFINTWDATTFLVCGQILAGFDDQGLAYGTGKANPWNNMRARPQLVDAFDLENDSRAMFYDYDRYDYSSWDDNLESGGYYKVDGDTDYYYKKRDKNISIHDSDADDALVVATGYRFAKWTNLTDAGSAATDCGSIGANTDFPVFRLADVYLMLAEAVLRGGSGSSEAEALGYVNDLQERAYGDATHNLSSFTDITYDWLCNERLREFYLEGIRRTDLIRFGRYTSGYNWQWKANVLNGADVNDKYNYLAIPEAEYSVNPRLQQVNNYLGY